MATIQLHWAVCLFLICLINFLHQLLLRWTCRTLYQQQSTFFFLFFFTALNHIQSHIETLWSSPKPKQVKQGGSGHHFRVFGWGLNPQPPSFRPDYHWTSSPDSCQCLRQGVRWNTAGSRSLRYLLFIVLGNSHWRRWRENGGEVMCALSTLASSCRWVRGYDINVSWRINWLLQQLEGADLALGFQLLHTFGEYNNNSRDTEGFTRHSAEATRDSIKRWDGVNHWDNCRMSAAPTCSQLKNMQ